MKKLISFILIISIFTGVTQAVALPRAFGVYEGSFETTLTIPDFTITNGFNNVTIESWDCTVTIFYRITYNLNTGKITNGTYLRSSLLSGDAISPDGLGYITGITYETVVLTITSDGNAIRCTSPTYTINALYYEAPELNAHQTRYTLSGSSETVYPPRD